MQTTTKFYLRDPKAKVSSLKCKIFYHAAKPLNYTVGEKVEVKLWSASKQRCREVQTYLDAPRINEALDLIESCAQQAANLLSDSERTPERMRKEVDKLLKRTSLSTGQSIKDIYNVLAERAKSVGTRNHFRSKGKAFQEFEQWQIDRGKRTSTYQWLEFRFADAEDFREFLVHRDFSPNTMSDHIKKLKRVFRYARKLELHNNPIADDREFTSPSAVAADVPALTVDEIKRFGKAECDTVLQEHVRDLFYMQSILCLRFGDTGVDAGQLVHKGDDVYLRKRSMKTLTKTMVKCPESVVEVLKKYDWKPPQYPRNQVTNKILKKLAERAQIDSPFTWLKQHGNEKTLITNLKYEMVSTHTARRSAATNMILSKMSPFYVMKLGGWSSIDQMMDYLKIDVEQLAYELADHEYFTGYN